MQPLTPISDYSAITRFPVIRDTAGTGWTFPPEAPYPAANLRALAMLMFHTANNRIPWLALKPGQTLDPSGDYWRQAQLLSRLEFFHSGPGRFTDWWQHVQPGDFIHADPLLENYHGLRHPTGAAIPVLLTLGRSDCLLDTTGESVINSKTALEITCHFLKALGLPAEIQQPFKTALKKTKARNIPGINIPNLYYSKDDTLTPIDELTSMIDFVEANTVLQAIQLLNTSTDRETLLDELEKTLKQEPRKSLRKKIMDILLGTFQEYESLYRPGIWDDELTRRTIESIDQHRESGSRYRGSDHSTTLKKIQNPLPCWTYLREDTMAPYREQLETSPNHPEILGRLRFCTAYPIIGLLAAMIFRIETRLNKKPAEIKISFLTGKSKDVEPHAKSILEGLVRHFERATGNERIWWEKYFIPTIHPSWKLLLAKHCNGPVPELFLRELVTELI